MDRDGRGPRSRPRDDHLRGVRHLGEELVVGRDYVYGLNYADAVRFSDGAPTELGTAPGAVASGVNSAGIAVGWAATGEGSAERAVVFRDGTVEDFGTIGGYPRSRLLAFNESGVAVGLAYGSADLWPRGSIGVIHAGDGLVDLNTLVDDPDWVIGEATGISDDGTIAAWGFRQSTMKPDTAIVLQPVQEPSARP